MSASVSASPGGQPSTTQPIAGPWLSPKDVTQNSLPRVLPDIMRLSQSAKMNGEFNIADSCVAAASQPARRSPTLKNQNQSISIAARHAYAMTADQKLTGDSSWKQVFPHTPDFANPACHERINDISNQQQTKRLKHRDNAA